MTTNMIVLITKTTGNVATNSATVMSKKGQNKMNIADDGEFIDSPVFVSP